MVGAVWAGRRRAQQTQAAAAKGSHISTDILVFIAIRSPSSNQGPVSCPGINLMVDDYNQIAGAASSNLQRKKLKG
jgi:hypothetical protein